MSKTFSHVAPVLPVDDAVLTAEYYKTKLGFDISFVYGDPPYYAIVQRGENATIHFSEREDSSTPITPCHVYVFVSDVDALYQEYEAKGIPAFSPPENQQYGMRELEIRDPNGHFLTFGQEL